MVPRSIAAGAEGNRMWRADATDRTFASALRRSLPNDLPQSLPGAHSRLADSQPSPAEFRMRLDELLGILNKGESSGGHALTVTQSSKDGKVLPVPYHRPRCSLRDRPQRGFFHSYSSECIAAGLCVPGGPLLYGDKRPMESLALMPFAVTATPGRFSSGCRYP